MRLFNQYREVQYEPNLWTIEPWFFHRVALARLDSTTRTLCAGSAAATFLAAEAVRRGWDLHITAQTETAAGEGGTRLQEQAGDSSPAAAGTTTTVAMQRNSRRSRRSRPEEPRGLGQHLSGAPADSVAGVCNDSASSSTSTDTAATTTDAGNHEQSTEQPVEPLGRHHVEPEALALCNTARCQVSLELHDRQTTEVTAAFTAHEHITHVRARPHLVHWHSIAADHATVATTATAAATAAAQRTSTSRSTSTSTGVTAAMLVRELRAQQKGRGPGPVAQEPSSPQQWPVNTAEAANALQHARKRQGGEGGGGGGGAMSPVKGTAKQVLMHPPPMSQGVARQLDRVLWAKQREQRSRDHVWSEQVPSFTATPQGDANDRDSSGCVSVRAATGAACVALVQFLVDHGVVCGDTYTSFVRLHEAFQTSKEAGEEEEEGEKAEGLEDEGEEVKDKGAKRRDVVAVMGGDGQDATISLSDDSGSDIDSYTEEAKEDGKQPQLESSSSSSTTTTTTTTSGGVEFEPQLCGALSRQRCREVRRIGQETPLWVQVLQAFAVANAAQVQTSYERVEDLASHHRMHSKHSTAGKGSSSSNHAALFVAQVRVVGCLFPVVAEGAGVSKKYAKRAACAVAVASLLKARASTPHALAGFCAQHLTTLLHVQQKQQEQQQGQHGCGTLSLRDQQRRAVVGLVAPVLGNDVAQDVMARLS